MVSIDPDDSWARLHGSVVKRNIVAIYDRVVELQGWLRQGGAMPVLASNLGYSTPAMLDHLAALRSMCLCFSVRT